MMAPTKTKTAAASLSALETRYAEAAEHQRQKPVRVYLAVLDAKVAALNGAPGIVPAIETEIREIAACETAVRAASEAVLRQFPEPKATTPRIVAAEVHALRHMALGARTLLDTNPPALAGWLEKITEIPDTAERTLGEAHWLSLWPLLGRTQALRGVPEALEAQVRFIEALVADHPAQSVPVEVAQGSGPWPESLETPKSRRAYRAETTVDHD